RGVTQATLQNSLRTKDSEVPPLWNHISYRKAHRLPYRRMRCSLPRCISSFDRPLPCGLPVTTYSLHTFSFDNGVHFQPNDQGESLQCGRYDSLPLWIAAGADKCVLAVGEEPRGLQFICRENGIHERNTSRHSRIPAKDSALAKSRDQLAERRPS